jgi:hypothetical protein
MGGVMRAAMANIADPTGVSQAPSNRTEGLDDLRAAVDAVSTGWAGGSSSWSASRGLTGIPTAPNRSPPGRAIAAWKSL